MIFAKISSIGDTLWRAIDWHRSGRRGQSQKTAALEQGLASGQLSNEYPFVLDEDFLRSTRATVRQEVIGEFENQWEEEDTEEEEARDLRVPREPEHPPSWVEFPNFPKQPSGPPPGRSDTSPSPRIVIAKAKTATGAVTTIASSSERSVPADHRRVTVAKAVAPATAVESRSSLPKASGEASSSGPKAVPVLREPPLPPPARGSVARGLALQEQRPKSSQGASSSSTPKPKGQPLSPPY